MASCLARFAGLAVGREAEQKRYFREKRIYTLQIESTDACGQACVYCYAGSTPKQAHALRSGEIRALLEDASRLEIRAIDWLGGDPLARPDWRELMEYARSLGLVNNVWTSGLLLKRPGVAASADELTQGGFVSVHVDSIFPQTYARLHPRGDPRNIAAIVEGVDNLLAAGKSPDQMFNCITYTSAQPAGDVIETMRWWLNEKGMRTCLTLFSPAGKGVEWRSLVPSTADARLVCRERDRLTYGGKTTSIGAMDTDKFYCGTMATVTFTGDVTPCSLIRDGVGNIRARPLAQIVSDHLGTLVHAELHDRRALPAPCDSCRDSSHCWGCRASAYHFGGDANGVDPACWRTRRPAAARELRLTPPTDTTDTGGNLS